MEWGKAQRRRLGPVDKCVAKDRDPTRKLKIAYLSADLYEHNVGDILLSILRGHRALREQNGEQFHVTCFQLNSKCDQQTEEMRQLCDKWIEVHGLGSAEEIVTRIRRENIDIMMDLGGHTTPQHCISNLDISALGPAPITVAWIGYPNTTGVDNLTYRFTDAVCDPIDSTQVYSEELVRLPTFFSSVSKDRILEFAVAPEPPCVRPGSEGKIVFGTCNNVRKCSSKTKRAWGKLLVLACSCALSLRKRMCSSHICMHSHFL